VEVRWRERRERGELDRGEAADVTLAEFRVLHELRGAAGDGFLDLRLGPLDARGRPVVEFRAELADGLEAAAAQVTEHLADVVSGLGIGLKQPVAAFLDDFHYSTCGPAGGLRCSGRHPPQGRHR
jgi:hypothetical protein